MNALQSLSEYYTEMNIKRINLPNQAEFQAYYILTHAWSNEVVSKMEWELPRHVFMDPQVQLAIEIRSLMARTNETAIRGRPSVDGSLNHYARIFNLLRKLSTSYLFACCVHIDFIDIRRGALKAMQKAYYLFDEKDSGFLLNDIVDTLGFNEEQEAIAMLTYHEIGVENIDGMMRVMIGKKRITDMYGKHSIAAGNFVGIIC